MYYDPYSKQWYIKYTDETYPDRKRSCDGCEGFKQIGIDACSGCAG